MFLFILLVHTFAYYCDDDNGVFSESSFTCVYHSGASFDSETSQKTLILTDYIFSTVVLNDFNYHLTLGTTTVTCSVTHLTIKSNTNSSYTYTILNVKPSLIIELDSNPTVSIRRLFLSSLTLPSEIINVNSNKIPLYLYLNVVGLELPETNNYLFLKGSFHLITSPTRPYVGYLFSSNSSEITTQKSDDGEIVSINCVNGYTRYYAFYDSIEHQLTCQCPQHAVDDRNCKVNITYGTKDFANVFMASGDQNIYRKDTNYGTIGDIGYTGGPVIVFMYSNYIFTVKKLN
ncbi:Hypothetical protein EIN_102590, partial [Entamoeba invadens IP1]